LYIYLGFMYYFNNARIKAIHWPGIFGKRTCSIIQYCIGTVLWSVQSTCGAGETAHFINTHLWSSYLPPRVIFQTCLFKVREYGIQIFITRSYGNKYLSPEMTVVNDATKSPRSKIAKKALRSCCAR
jgi:hypothetical protein